MTEATLSSKHQIVIPREAREALDLRPGDRLLIVVRGDRVLVLEKPKSHREALTGLGRGVFPKNYLKKERSAWR